MKSNKSMTAPLRVCYTVESVAWSSVCAANFTFPWKPDGTPATVSLNECVDDVSFCGYGAALWDVVSTDIGLREGRDWVRVCVGGSAFYDTLEDLSEGGVRGPYRPATCDMVASGLIADYWRAQDLGLQFTSAISRSSVAVMVRSEVIRRGRWEFMRPFTAAVWIAILIMVLTVPVAAIGHELVMRRNSLFREISREPARPRTRYKVLACAYAEGLWQSVGQLLQTRVMGTRSLPSRIVCAAFAIATQLLISTYLANLSAWLVSDRLASSEQSVRELWNKSVGTYPVYQDVMASVYNVKTFAIPAEGPKWGERVAQSIVHGDYFAAVLDESVIVPLVSRSADCSLRMITERVTLSDTVLAFRRTFDDHALMRSVDHRLLQLQQSGRMQQLRARFEAASFDGDTVGGCDRGVVIDDAAQPVPFRPLSGLWVVYACCVVLAIGFGAFKLALARKDPGQRDLNIRTHMLMSTIMRHRGGNAPALTRQTTSRSSRHLVEQRARDKLERTQVLIADLIAMVRSLEWYAQRWEHGRTPTDRSSESALRRSVRERQTRF